MMLKKTTFCLFLLGLGSFGYAGDMGVAQKSNTFFAVSGGPSWTNTGSSQTIALQPDVVKAYVPQTLTNSNVLGNLEIVAGVQKSYFDHVKSQFAVALYWSSFATLNGFIQEDADPNFQNFSYQYKISHGHIALKTKWIAENALNLNPYVSGSVGLGFNRSYGYNATPIILQEVAAPPFQSNTKAALSASFGAGFQHTLNSQITLALGYQLVSWGSSALDRAVDQTRGEGLGLSTLYTQGIEFTISYFL